MPGKENELILIQNAKKKLKTKMHKKLKFKTKKIKLIKFKNQNVIVGIVQNKVNYHI